MLLVLGIAFATSFTAGSDGAHRLGYAGVFMYALPLVCDVVAAAATWIHGRVRTDRDMRRLAGWFVLTPMLLSWGANAIDHGFRAVPEPGWHAALAGLWIGAVVLAAGICPVAVAALLHFATRYADYEQRLAKAAAAESERRAARAAPTRVAANRPRSNRSGRSVGDAARRATAVTWTREHWPATVAEIQLGAKVSRRDATTIRREVDAEQRAAS